MRNHWLATAFAVAILHVAGAYGQQHYPSKPIRLIVPFAPGGGADIVARMLGQKLIESFGQPVVVDNRGGGGGTIGIETAVRATPDGYTMILLTSGYTTNAALDRLPHDPLKDVTPIALVGETGFIVAVHPSLPVKGIKDLIAYDKAHPAKLNYGSAGTGGITHVATELINQMAGINMTHVPYKGAGPALADLLGGKIQLILGGTPSTLPHVKANRLRALAVTNAKRSNAVPDIPAVAESVPGYEAVLWFAVLGPKALPKNVVAQWNKEIDRILTLADVKERLARDSVAPLGGSPTHLHNVLQRDIAKWRKVIRTSGIKATA